MAHYYLNEAVLDLPDLGFVDKTVHGLESRLPGDRALGIFVHRRPVEADVGLAELVDENVALNERRLAAFAVLARSAEQVGGAPAIVVRARWRQAGRERYQAQLHAIVGRAALVFAVGGPIEERERCDVLFASLRDTLAWRSE